MSDRVIIVVTAVLLAFSTAVNIHAAIRLNRAYDKVADIFCVPPQ
ncbi:hypothetical protein [Bradyrhizobium diazoefficiens]|nr:hypothetical protein XF16B_46030 [Bradyrhizobium diazoefficiens]BCF70256.1 hypothetical protein XF19B_46090 [Bradyrhizobium diazoefficiens]